MKKEHMRKANELSVLPEWIDHNNHMNVAYYVLIFDQSLDEVLDLIELTRDYRKKSGNTVYVLETHVTYVQEVKEGDLLEIYAQVIDCDDKRMHLYLEMYHKEEGFLAATSEQMIMHIDASGPKAAVMPEFIQKNLQNLKEEAASGPQPARVGAKIGIRRK